MAEVELVFDRGSHSADAIQRAAYRFCDRFALELRVEAEQYRCVLACTEGVDDATVNDFRTEVLDQVLRERIRDETAAVRNVILASAFSNADLEP